LFTDGVTEARSHIDLHGDEWLRDLIAPLRSLSAAGIAEAIQQATLSSSGGTVCPFSGRACR
jgi:serine phosphatase RsbU (regulator of sigma subunit)